MSDSPEKKNDQLADLKRRGSEIVDDLRARKLLLPVIVLAVAIAAAVVVLPQKSSDVAPPSTSPSASIPQGPTGADNVANVALIDLGELPSGQPLADSVNPFKQGGGYDCTTVSNSPKVLECVVGGLKLQVQCIGGQAKEPPCTPEKSSGGASGSTGSAGGGSGSTQSTGGTDTTPTTPTIPNTPSYTINVQFDGRSQSKLKPGAGIPSSGNPTVVFRDVMSDGKAARFQVPEGSIVTGVTVDASGLNFALEKNDTATITDRSGNVHKLKLTSITKVKS